MPAKGAKQDADIVAGYGPIAEGATLMKMIIDC